MKEYFSEADDALQSTYPPSPVASIIFGYYPAPDQPDQEPVELTMEWCSVEDRLVPHLECNQDAFRAIGRFSEVFAELSKLSKEDLQPDEFRRLLDRLGFADITKTIGSEKYLER